MNSGLRWLKKDNTQFVFLMCLWLAAAKKHSPRATSLIFKQRKSESRNPSKYQKTHCFRSRYFQTKQWVAKLSRKVHFSGGNQTLSKCKSFTSTWMSSVRPSFVRKDLVSYLSREVTRPRTTNWNSSLWEMTILTEISSFQKLVEIQQFLFHWLLQKIPLQHKFFTSLHRGFES